MRAQDLEEGKMEMEMWEYWSLNKETSMMSAWKEKAVKVVVVEEEDAFAILP